MAIKKQYQEYFEIAREQVEHAEELLAMYIRDFGMFVHQSKFYDSIGLAIKALDKCIIELEDVKFPEFDE